MPKAALVSSRQGCDDPGAHAWISLRCVEMLVRVFDMRMHDGSRHFGDIRETYREPPEWYLLRDAVPSLAGAELTGFVTDDVTEAWVDFRWRGHAFSMNNQHGHWWFFVTEPSCPDELLVAVLDHFEAALRPEVALARSLGPIADGARRVVVHEADARISFRDFADPREAQRYADDAASEAEHGPVSARIFDEDFEPVGEGKHY